MEFKLGVGLGVSPEAKSKQPARYQVAPNLPTQVRQCRVYSVVKPYVQP